jgi:integrase
MKIEYLSKKEIDEMLAKASESSQRDYLLLKTLVLSGMRASEVVGSSELPGLRLQDINAQEGTIIVAGKGSKYRNVDVPRELCRQLQMYSKANNIKKRDRIFDITRQRAWQISKEIAGVRTHALRHTYAILLLRKTRNIRYLQKQLGHDSLNTTQIYLQFMSFDEEKKMVESLI